MTPVANLRWRLYRAGVAEINEDLGKKATAVVNDNGVKFTTSINDRRWSNRCQCH